MAGGLIKFSKTVKTGWQKKKGKWRYYDYDGHVVKGEWKKSGYNWYHLGADGYVEKDCFVIEHNGHAIYYVDKNGVMVTNTFVIHEGKKRYFLDDGKAIMDGERVIDEKTYIFKNGYVEKE